MAAGFALYYIFWLIVELEFENPCVGGSIPPRATKNKKRENTNPYRLAFLFVKLAAPVSGPFPVKARETAPERKNAPRSQLFMHCSARKHLGY